MGDYRIWHTEQEGVTPDGGKIEVSYGCSGVKHAALPVTVWRDEKGESTHAECDPVRELGPCDGTCTTDDLGGFLHPYPVVRV